MYRCPIALPQRGRLDHLVLRLLDKHQRVCGDQEADDLVDLFGDANNRNVIRQRIAFG